jgi:hypothetical protein
MAGGIVQILKFLLPAGVLLAGVLVSSSTSLAKPEDTKKTKKPCTFCHVSAKGGTELTAAGKYYKEKGTLDGYRAPEK